MKRLATTTKLTASAIALVASMAVASAQNGVETDARTAALELKIQQLQAQNRNLSKALVHSREQEKKANGELNKIRLELEALNMYPLGTDDQRLVEAVANRKVLEERLSALETAAANLSAQVREYIKHAIVAEDKQRKALETKIRELDMQLGIIDKPRPQIDQGTLHQAKIVGIDSQSGVIILNAGEKQQVRLGMSFSILRGKVQIAEARVAEVRNNISGALVTRLYDSNSAVRPGDIASIKTQN